MNIISYTLTAILILSLLAGCATTVETYERVPYVEDGTLEGELSNLTNEMIEPLLDEDITRIGVLEPKNVEGRVSELGNYIAEELIARLHLTQHFEVLELQMVKEALSELNIERTRMLNEESIAAMGRMLGLQAVIDGTIIDLEERINVELIIYDTEEREMIAEISSFVMKDDYIERMMNIYEDRPDMLEETDPPPSPTGITTAEAEEFDYPVTVVDELEFEVVSAFIDPAGEVIIEILITNLAPNDREIGIGRRTMMIDELGNEYSNPSRTINTTIAGGTAEELRYIFLTDVPVTMILEFSDVDPYTGYIPLLTIVSEDLSTNVILENIPLER